MHLDVDSYDQILAEFLSTWTVDRVNSMTIEEYTDTGNHDTFCYQVEWGTEKLGSISGVSLVKFGVWKRKNDKEYKRKSILQDEQYSWLEKYGSDSQTAFETVRSLISSTIDHAKKQEFDQIENIDLHSIAKWKIAFLYSKNKLLPIYSRESLILIARGIGIKVQSHTKTSQLHSEILKRKPDNEKVVNFAFGLWHKYVANASERSYYVVGSKYRRGDGTYQDMFLEMHSKSVVATGYLWNYDLNNLIGASKEIVYKFVESHKDEFEEDLKSVQKTIFLFSGLKPGDIVAIKSEGAYNRLTIIAYAQVIKRNDSIYLLDDVLGQCINVNFLEFGLQIQTELNYARTIHRIDSIKKPEHFTAIFGTYSLIDLPIETQSTSNDNEGGNDKDKKTESYERKGVEPTTVNLVHNKIQNAFKEFLKILYPKETIIVEFNKRVDILRSNDSELYFYEVKPYNSVQECIRAGIGQLLQYHFLFENKNKQTFLRIVGMKEPTQDDERFIEYLKNRLDIDFDYEPFNPFN